MATKSILKDIVIRDKKAGEQFVLALEYAEKIKPREVVYSKQCNTISKDQIRSIFDKKR